MKIPQIAVLVLLNVVTAFAQSPDKLGETWRGPDRDVIRSILNEKHEPGASSTNPSSDTPVKFTPSADSGVSKTLAQTFGRTPQEIATLKDAFDQIKRSYQSEVAKERKSNNVAAALAFFLATNFMVFNDSAPPSDAASEQMFIKLQNLLSASSAFRRSSNAEKQQMHDWLVCVAGFALANYQDAKKNGDAEGLKTIREFAGYATQMVMGTPSETQTVNPKRSTSVEVAKIVGVWSISASGQSGNGYSKGQYVFQQDGSYNFKSERWFGYMRSKEFYTTEESGTYSVSGSSLTISPSSSKTILRDPEGIVQKTQTNRFELITYKWQLHYFEGINETQLILQPPRETVRDGGFSQSSLFPNAYLYSQGSKLEWRF